MSKYEARQQKAEEMRSYAEKAARTFSQKDTTHIKKECIEQVEEPYISSFEMEA